MSSISTFGTATFKVRVTIYNKNNLETVGSRVFSGDEETYVFPVETNLYDAFCADRSNGMKSF